MPASGDEGFMAKVMAWVSGGAAAGAGIAFAQAAIQHPAPTTPNYVGKLAMGHAGKLASIAGVFAATDSILTSVRGHSGINQAVAGCASGGVLGAMMGGPQSAAFYCVLFGTLQGAASIGMRDQEH
jgi:hypothetical protein